LRLSSQFFLGRHLPRNTAADQHPRRKKKRKVHRAWPAHVTRGHDGRGGKMATARCRKKRKKKGFSTPISDGKIWPFDKGKQGKKQPVQQAERHSLRVSVLGFRPAASLFPSYATHAPPAPTLTIKTTCPGICVRWGKASAHIRAWGYPATFSSFSSAAIARQQARKESRRSSAYL